MEICTPAEDPRVRRTRDLLKGAMLALMAEKSWRDISVGDITQRATVNRTTFYAHFDDKEELLECCLRDKSRRALRELGRLRREKAAEDMERLIEGVFTFLAQIPRQCPQAVRQWEPVLIKTMQEEVAAVLRCWLRLTAPGQTEGARQKEAARETVIAAMSGAIVWSGIRWLRGGEDLPVKEGAAEVAALILRGVLSFESISE